MNEPPRTATLDRELGVFGATMMGLGSIVGTGVFVSIGIGAGIAGPSVILAIVAAAFLATCNALSSAQLAASHPVSGGTYEYGYRYLSPWLGFTAGWVFLLAKTASAATAALGFAGYLLALLGADATLQMPVALVTVVLFTALVLSGLRRSNRMNVVIVAVALGSLIALILFGAPVLATRGSDALRPVLPQDASAFFHATALMFVAYTGYARIATMGEEVKEPRRTIPRAIAITLWVSAALYVAVATVSVGLIGSAALARAVETSATPLERAAEALNVPGLPVLIAAGAMTAMLGVLLNLLLGLSRVVLAMGRKGDLPPRFGTLTQARTPAAAILLSGAVTAGLAAIGSVQVTWTFSAFTVLLYYAITNLAALRLPRGERLYPAAISLAGLMGCLFLAFWVPVPVWLTGVALIAAGLVWHAVAMRLWSSAKDRIGP